MTPSFHYVEFEGTKGVIRIVYRRRTDNTMAKRNKVQKDKQRSTKHTYKTKDRVTRTPLKTGGELRCSGRLSSSLPFFIEVAVPSRDSGRSCIYVLVASILMFSTICLLNIGTVLRVWYFLLFNFIILFLPIKCIHFTIVFIYKHIICNGLVQTITAC